MESSDRVVVLNTTVRPDQLAALERYRKEAGLISRSAALRAILDDWAKMRNAGLVTAFLPTKESA
jgi:hypothetical protein